MTERRADDLRSDPEPFVVSYWQEDIARLPLLMVTGPGHRLATPTLILELLDLPLFDSEAASAVPQNACYDTMALRPYILRTDY